jgi:mRNA-degrading endonuclease RelE of RelBE toxin-antitoxin system
MSGGVRVIYYVLNSKEEIVLLTLYAKTSIENLNAAKLKEIRDALEK